VARLLCGLEDGKSFLQIVTHNLGDAARGGGTTNHWIAEIISIGVYVMGNCLTIRWMTEPKRGDTPL